MDDGCKTPCCYFASDEDIDGDAEMYRCDECPVVVAIEGLSDVNRRAWDLFRETMTRFAVSVGVAGPALMRRLADCDEDELTDMLARLAILYEAYYPPKKAPADGA